jgi:hypothetical protein
VPPLALSLPWRAASGARNTGAGRLIPGAQASDRPPAPTFSESTQTETNPNNTKPETHLTMKHIIEILILLAIIVSIGALTSCIPEKSTPRPPVPPEPHKVFKEQVNQERDLRQEAETRAEKESSRVKFWESACVVVFVGACIAFITGTAIGSKGRKHANS